MTDPIQLPRELVAQIEAFERRLRRVETGVALLAGLAGALCTIALLALMDRFFDAPRAVRVLLTLAGAAAAAGAAGWWAHHWLFRRRDARELARLVQRAYPRLGDRLLGAVELSRSDADIAGASPALLRAALRQVAAESRAYDFIRAAPLRAARRYAAGLAAVLALLGLAAALMPDALWQSVRRWVRPAAPVERYTFVRLSDLPAEWVVPRGEPFELEVAIEAGSRWHPAAARARIGAQAVVRAEVRGGRALFKFPGQLEVAPLAVRAGDARRQLTIRPLARPELAEFHARIEWPAYLHREPEVRRLDQGRIVLLPESSVMFEGTVSRELGSASVLPGVTEGTPVGEPLAVNGSVFRSPLRTAAEWITRYPSTTTNVAALVFQWTDPHGLTQARPFRVELAAGADAPPTVQIADAPAALAVLEEEVITLRVRGADDFGLSAIGIEWGVTEESQEEGSSASAPAKPSYLTEKALQQDATGQKRDMDATHRVSPAMMRAGPGSTIRLVAWAADGYPNRDRTRSAPLVIHVLSNEEHARLILRQMAELSARLEEALREEERLLAAHSALQTLDEAALSDPQSEGTLERGRDSERQNAAETESIAADAEQLMREALRNPLMKTDDIQPWMQAAERLKGASAQEMRPASESLGQAASQPSSRREPLDQAVAHEQSAVEALRRAAQDTNRAMESSEARNFINRLREIAKQERRVGSDLTAFLPSLIGLSPAAMEPAQRSAVAGPIGSHMRQRREAGYVRDDLGAFYARTRIEIYETVRTAMGDPDVFGQFDGLLKRMNANQLVTVATGTDALAVRFDEWANQLESGQPPSQGGGQGGGQQQGLEPDVLLGLMRARVQEEMLREQTRAADEDRESEWYAGVAQKIAKRQRAIAGDLFTMSYQTRMQQAAQMIRKMADTADEAGAMLEKPDTGPNAIAAQTEIIELIAQATQGQRGSSPSQGQQQQQGEQPGQAQEGEGPQGGGSHRGGDSVDTGPVTGPGGGDTDVRTGERGGGGDPATWPAEYRDAIQRYYEAMEREP